MKIKELLATEDKWTKGFSARGADQHFVPPNSPDAVCWCLIGAAVQCYPLLDTPGFEANTEALNKICNAITGKSKERSRNQITTTITAFNDSLATAFSDVRRVLEQADV